MEEKQKYEIKAEDLLTEICTALRDCFVAQIVMENEGISMKFPHDRNFVLKISKVE